MTSVTAVRERPREAAATVERRGETRAQAGRPGRLFQGQLACDCRIANASTGGAKLTGVTGRPNSAPILLIDLEAGTAWRGGVVWQVESELGVRFEERWDLTGAVPLWLRAAQGYWQGAVRATI